MSPKLPDTKVKNPFHPIFQFLLPFRGSPANYTSSPPLTSTGTPPQDTATVPHPRHSTLLQGPRAHQAPSKPRMVPCLPCHQSPIAPKEITFKTIKWMEALPRMLRVVFVIRAGLSSDGSNSRSRRSLVGLRVVGAELGWDLEIGFHGVRLESLESCRD